MKRIIDVVHRDQVRLLRALKRFRSAFECGQLLLARELFDRIAEHVREYRGWEKAIVHRVVQGTGTSADLQLLARDDRDHRQIAARLAAVRRFLQRSVDGEMGLDRPLLEELGTLERKLEKHARGVEEPLGALADRALPPNIAADVASRAAARWHPQRAPRRRPA